MGFEVNIKRLVLRLLLGLLSYILCFGAFYAIPYLIVDYLAKADPWLGVISLITFVVYYSNLLGKDLEKSL